MGVAAIMLGTAEFRVVLVLNFFIGRGGKNWTFVWEIPVSPPSV